MSPKTSQQKTELEIPKDWQSEIKKAADRRNISEHDFLLKAIRRVLDGENLKK